MRQTFFQIFILAFIFIVAFVLEIMPWPNDFQGYRPTWVVLVLLYWALALPDKVSLICCWYYLGSCSWFDFRDSCISTVYCHLYHY